MHPAFFPFLGGLFLLLSFFILQCSSSIGSIFTKQSAECIICQFLSLCKYLRRAIRGDHVNVFSSSCVTGTELIYYKWSNSGSRYNKQHSSYPVTITSVFPGLPVGLPIDAADAYIGNWENTGPVFIIKSDIVYEFDFTATNSLSATYLRSFHVTSAAVHPFNAIPQTPPQMPSGITALHVSKHHGQSFAFVGSHFYIHYWGTGTWSYQGRVICPVDPWKHTNPQNAMTYEWIVYNSVMTVMHFVCFALNVSWFLWEL